MTPARIDYAGIGDEAADPLSGQLAAIRWLGWGGIELRTVDGRPLADLDADRFAALADAVRARGIRVVAVASRIGGWARPVTGDFAADLDELAALAPRCAALGTPYLRVMSYPPGGLAEAEWGRRARERLRRLAGAAEQSGLVLLHENCAGWAGASPRRMLDLIAAAGSPALRLLFDTGNGVAYGYDSHAVLSVIADHVAHVHVKDGLGGPAGPRWTLPGAGRARVADCLRLLLDRGYRGAWSIEPHLAFRPDAGVTAGRGRFGAFVEAGRALTALVHRELLPRRPGWAATPEGLVHGGPG